MSYKIIALCEPTSFNLLADFLLSLTFGFWEVRALARIWVEPARRNLKIRVIWRSATKRPEACKAGGTVLTFFPFTIIVFKHNSAGSYKKQHHWRWRAGGCPLRGGEQGICEANDRQPPVVVLQTKTSQTPTKGKKSKLQITSELCDVV